jgi:hypothetical protein
VNEDRGQRDEPRWRPGWQPGPDEPPADILEQGGRRFLPPNLGQPRVAAILLAVGLVTGLAVGYAAGHRQPAGSANHAAASAGPATPVRLSAPVRQGAPAYQGGPLLASADDICSARSGRKLQLGAEVTNESARSVRLGQIRAVLPLGGLRATSQRWAPCGAFETGQDPTSLGPGDSVWFSVTFRVLVRCPEAFPVWFTLGYSAAGQPATARVPAFPDLEQVPYTGCPR